MKIKKIILLFIIVLVSIFLIVGLIPKFKFTNDEILVGENFIPDIDVISIFYDYDDNFLVDTSSVNFDKVGSYKFECKYKFLFFYLKKYFYVNVIDKDKPVIELKGDNPASVCKGKDYHEEGYNASDNYDGDITKNVIIKKNADTIVYTVQDSSGNESKVERKIVIEDVKKPSIKLKGNKTMYLYLGDKYREPGYSASDNCDGNITKKVIKTGDVDTSKVGSYVINYTVKDSDGNSSTVKRTIIVRKKNISSGSGVIYLTFDDGPSYVTEKILDILDEENVKATFFVTSANKYTKRAYNSGHTIGLHSYTHNYSYIYKSSKNYFSDLNKISDKVYNVVGIRTKIIRFPGGSSNTISRNYNKGIMTYLTKEVINRGYTYFDWNVGSNDTGKYSNNSNKIYYNVVNNLSHDKTNIVLMHDSSGHDASANALRKIILYGKENNYTFKAITENTPVVRHGVQN